MNGILARLISEHALVVYASYENEPSYNATDIIIFAIGDADVSFMAPFISLLL